jgi:hypothetical protein
MPATFFVVRATVSDPAKRTAFDEWYHREHLPDAVKAFGVKKAWRFWSVSDPALHQASYEFFSCWRRNLARGEGARHSGASRSDEPGIR